MPFTFKPDISPDGSPSMASPVSDVGNQAPTPTLASREVPADSSLVDLVIRAALAIALLIVLGLVIYKYYLGAQVDMKKADLAGYESQLGGLPLEDMRKLSNRIKLVNQLVKEHPSVNAAFKILEDSIENQVTYTGFDLRYNDVGKNYQLQLRGYAPSYRSIAQQMDTYNRKPYSNYVPSIAVEGLTPNDQGNIQFLFKMPVAIAGVLPENVQLSDTAGIIDFGSVNGNGSSTVSTFASTTPVSASTTPSGTKTGTSTPLTGSTTPKR